ncbi:MAG: bifunctional transaldolase/phosoglucose isomerase [Terriglobia bacterium]|jgi:transaldolase/glucose-6-phosphate isomerase
MSNNPLRVLNSLGQSVWFDYIRRSELTSGHLKALVDADGVSGVTSNPSIFEKAIAGSNDYDEAIRKLVEAGEETPLIFEALEVEDIRTAADIFRPVYDSTEGRDGFVSIEVAPTLARDTQGTIAEAHRLWQRVDRPNVLVKVPGTAEGLPAIEHLLGEGININITLLFAIERYEEVAWAYIAALEKLAREGKPLDRIASVASFFVSRIDVMGDQQLAAKIPAAKNAEEKQRLEWLEGKTAIANAKLAYVKFKEIFASARFQALAKKGARVQRMLWASTGTKNPNYSDTLYIDTLIGPDTINTMPVASLAAYRDHGKPAPRIEEGLDEARSVMQQLAEEGLDLAVMTRKLEEQGVDLFTKDYEKLLAALAEKRRQYALPPVQPAAIDASLQAATHAALERLEAQGFSRRLWERDATLWKQDPDHQKIIRNALGWLTVAQTMLKQLDVLEGFPQEIKSAGFTQQVLLGMGGSSLCPDVCRATFGTRPGFLPLTVLDSTVPASVAAVEDSVDLANTLFLVSSKSGGTTETTSFFQYFHDRVRSIKGDKAGENFVAITDPGTSLEKLAKEKNFRRVFPGQPDIGGRYSALSNFGMIPAALAGVHVHGLLERAAHMAAACGANVAAKDTPGLVLGAALGAAGLSGRDKITFVISPAIETFADWVEQLIAESTGKEGKGLVPVAGEALHGPAAYRQDRLFVQIKLTSEADEATECALQALEAAGHPVIRIILRDVLDLGAEFFRWEVATATAGALLGIDPFDQPNVQESKDNTKSLLAEYRAQGKFPEGDPLLESDGLKVYGDAATLGAAATSVGGALAAFLNQGRPGDYVALMAYIQPTPEHTVALQSLRQSLREASHLATTLGYGPRFLHSTGQLHKGGANNGLFIQITADDAQDLPIPGEPYTFAVLKHAQALGDLRSLASKQRRFLRLHLGGDAGAQLARLGRLVQDALRPSVHATAG